MYENTVVDMNIVIGNIPLTIAQNAPQFSYPTQPLSQNNFSNGQFPANFTQNIGFIEPTPVSGFVQQVPPYESPPITAPYPQQSMIPTQSTLPQPLLYPETHVYDQSQLPYYGVNLQQPPFNPSYPSNLNQEVISESTKSSF